MRGWASYRVETRPGTRRDARPSGDIGLGDGTVADRAREQRHRLFED